MPALQDQRANAIDNPSAWEPNVQHCPRSNRNAPYRSAQRMDPAGGTAPSAPLASVDALSTRGSDSGIGDASRIFAQGLPAIPARHRVPRREWRHTPKTVPMGNKTAPNEKCRPDPCTEIAPQPERVQECSIDTFGWDPGRSATTSFPYGPWTAERTVATEIDANGTRRLRLPEIARQRRIGSLLVAQRLPIGVPERQQEASGLLPPNQGPRWRRCRRFNSRKLRTRRFRPGSRWV